MSDGKAKPDTVAIAPAKGQLLAARQLTQMDALVTNLARIGAALEQVAAHLARGQMQVVGGTPSASPASGFYNQPQSAEQAHDQSKRPQRPRASSRS